MQFEKVEKDMNRSRASISKMSGRDFWELQWTVHGLDGGDVWADAETYFQDGIKAHQRLDLRAALQLNQIKFDAQVNYTKQDIIDAPKSTLEVRKYIHLLPSIEGYNVPFSNLYMFE